MRPIPQRAFQAPIRSACPSAGEITGTLPAGVSSQRWKPATRSSTFPLTAGVFGPQQGGLSRAVPPAGDCAIGSISCVIAVFPRTAVPMRP